MGLQNSADRFDCIVDHTKPDFKFQDILLCSVFLGLFDCVAMMLVWMKS